jgi:hypothetical protein
MQADMMMCEPSTLDTSDMPKDMLTSNLVVILNVPHVIGDPLSTALTWFLGVFIGRWLLGYKASYEEYSHENSE